MPIHPLPQFEEDLAEYLQEKEDREAYERLKAPTSIVVRFGYMRMVGEFPYTGEAKPGCGSKIVVRTHRGTEIGEMLTSTCPNAGCSKSVTRKEMLEYIENSGGRQYPFHDRGKALRIATPEDLSEQERLEQKKNELRMTAKRMIEQAGLPMQVIEAEPLLGGERIVIYFGADDRIDFRDLVQEMQREFGCKVELRQIGARDEARITADYERCGQYCCCKNFLKVLKPVSMKSAKVQKATLDPLKISGRCGRLMCCLRYEDETYEQLRKNLPHRKSRVGTPDGDGFVVSTQILTQLALIKLDNGTEAAFPIEDLTEPDSKTPPERDARPRRGDRSGSRDGSRSGRSKPTPKGDSARSAEPRDKGTGEAGEGTGTKKKKRRRRRRKGSGEKPGAGETTQRKTDVPSDRGASQAEPRSGADSSSDSGPDSGGGGDRPKKKRRRRRRRRGGGGESGGGSNNAGGGSQGGD
ncbi:MAG: PSP1 domain-containing protein [Phycisphaerales bacterium]